MLDRIARYEPTNAVPFTIATTLARLFDKKKTWLNGTIGESGDGKSRSDITIAHELYPEFNADNISFDPVEFLDILRSRPPMHSGFILEESGILLSHKNWQTVNNKMMNYILQAFRKRRIFVMFNMPVLTLLDKTSRALLNDILEVHGVNREKRYCEAKWLHVQTNARTGFPYTPLPKYISAKGRCVVDWVRIYDPEIVIPDVVAEYEKRKDKFITKMEQEAYTAVKQAKLMRGKEDAIMKKVTDLITEETGEDPDDE